MSGHGHGSHGHGGKASSVVSPSLIKPSPSSSSSSSSSHGHGHGSSSSSHAHVSSSKAKAAEKEKKAPPAWPIFRKSLPYLWPKDSVWLRFCFVMSMLCLLAGSLLDLYTPIATKYAVDELSGNVEEGIDPILPWQWILVYGVVRFFANFFQQLRDVFFAAVGAETERRVALETFNHLQGLSLSFHLRRETGGVLRSVSRGAQSFATLSRIVLFQILPIFLQLIVVCVYLVSLYPWYFSFLTFAIIAFYFVFTFTTTNWRDRYRRVMNEKVSTALILPNTLLHVPLPSHGPIPSPVRCVLCRTTSSIRRRWMRC
jgi:ABC-type bacteriocin/lantibiotic exporter with double-glycine peptidase domain